MERSVTGKNLTRINFKKETKESSCESVPENSIYTDSIERPGMLHMKQRSKDLTSNRKYIEIEARETYIAR